MATTEERIDTRGATGRDSLDRTIDRIKSEYREMPGLQLTFEQMVRLWMLDRATCRVLLEQLLDAQFLKTTRDGRYMRGDMGRDRATGRSRGARALQTSR